VRASRQQDHWPAFVPVPVFRNTEANCDGIYRHHRSGERSQEKSRSVKTILPILNNWRRCRSIIIIIIMLRPLLLLLRQRRLVALVAARSRSSSRPSQFLPPPPRTPQHLRNDTTTTTTTTIIRFFNSSSGGEGDRDRFLAVDQPSAGQRNIHHRPPTTTHAVLLVVPPKRPVAATVTALPPIIMVPTLTAAPMDDHHHSPARHHDFHSLPPISSSSSSSTRTTTTNQDEAAATSTAATTITAAPIATTMNAAPQRQQQQRLELRDVYRRLGLSEFTDREIDDLYNAIVGSDTATNNGGGNTPKNDTTTIKNTNNTAATAEKPLEPPSSSSQLLLLTETNLQAYLLRRGGRGQTEEDEAILSSQVQHENNDYASSLSSSSSSVSLSSTSDTSSSSSSLAREILIRLELVPSRTAAADIGIGIDQATFRVQLQRLAGRVDYYQLLPIALSMGITGVAVGIVNPAMPLVVEQLQLTSSEYGTVVAAFGLAKLLLNIPAAVVTEKYGRKPFLTYGSMPLLALGVGGIGAATNASELFVLRLLTGTGVALLSTAATLMLTDTSTPRNRASTIAPVMSGFSIGMVVGPGLGGYAMDLFGLQHTFYMVGASYLCVGLVNQVLLAETKQPPPHQQHQQQQQQQQQQQHHLLPKSSSSSTSPSSSSPPPPSSWQGDGSTLTAVLTDWRDVLTSQPPVRNVIAMNAVYWTTLAGAQMTILPLLMTTSAGYTAVDVGHVYMGMSALQIVGNPLFAAISDQIGRLPVLLTGTALMGASLFYFDGAATATAVQLYPDGLLLPALAVWSVGSSMLSTAPVAYVSDHVPAEQRAAAIALLRTAGDVGLLVGSMGTGYLAHVTSIPTALSSLAYLIWASTALLGTSVALRKWKKK
jgi:MFS family permease